MKEDTNFYKTQLDNRISACIYANDTQIRITERNATSELHNTGSQIFSLAKTNNKFELNPDKTEFILFGSDEQCRRLANCFPIDILGSELSPSDKVCNWVWCSILVLHNLINVDNE